MKFCIQASNPQMLDEYEETDDTLSSAIETSFPMNTEDAIMIWNNIAIRLSYKYDVSYMIEDILFLLRSLREEEKGVLKISWLPDTFRSDWLIKWNKSEVSIETVWENVVGDITEILNKNPNILIEKYQFVNEWKQLLNYVINGLKKCHYNEENMPQMQELIYEFSLIKGNGVLY